jgi:hypothetical protein
MARPARIDVLQGDVTKVQLTSETHVIPAAKGRAAKSEVVNKMRVFLRDRASGRETDVTFADTTVGVHEGHTIAVGRAFVPGRRGPVLLTLVNESTGQREEFAEGFARALRTETFGPRWKAFGLSTALFVIGWLWNALFGPATPGVWRGLWPLFLAFLAYPAFWAGVAGLDGLTRVRSDAAETARMRAEIARLSSGPRDVTPTLRDAPGTIQILPPPR